MFYVLLSNLITLKQIVFIMYMVYTTFPLLSETNANVIFK